MNALVLAVLLLAEPAAPVVPLVAVAPAPARLDAAVPGVRPLPLPERVFEAVERDRLDRGFFRVTLGGGGVSGLSGVSPTVLVGVEVSPWRHVGFRGGMGMVAATGGGAWSSAELSAAVVYHASPGGLLNPYVAAGAQVGVLSLYEPTNARPMSFATSNGDPIVNPDSSSGRGPVSSFAAPEVQVGVNTRLRGRLSLDIGVRYLPLTYKGETRSAFSGLFTLCTPF
jgi:hypothetical protein